MVDADIPGSANDWGIALVGDKAGFGVGDGGAGATILSTSPVNNGAWHHVVATRVNATGAMKLYIDGTLQASGTGSTALRNAPGGIRLGSTLFGGTYFNGAIDDLRIFNYTLGSPQAAALASTLPALWTAADIGNPGSDGYAGYSAAGAGVFTVVGGGTDIGATSDQFHFLSTPVSGDQTAVTRMTSIPVNINGTTTANAKAGLMFRNSSAANAAFVDVTYDHTAGLRFLYRDTAGASVGQVGGSVPIAAPFWLKLVRSGDTFTASYATTGSLPLAGDWISLGTHNTSLISSPLAGLAVTSRNAGQVATATFSNLAVFASTPGNRWRQDYFGSAVNAGNAADAADPDRDGMSNLLERALGLNPNLVNGPGNQPQLSQAETYLSLFYTRNLAATDLQYQVVWSADLITWSATDVTDTFVSSTATTETREARVPMASLNPAHSFLRLQVTP